MITLVPTLSLLSSVGIGRTSTKGAPMPKSVHGCWIGKVGIWIAYLSRSIHVVFIGVKSVWQCYDWSRFCGIATFADFACQWLFVELTIWGRVTKWMTLRYQPCIIRPKPNTTQPYLLALFGRHMYISPPGSRIRYERLSSEMLAARGYSLLCCGWYTCPPSSRA